MSAPSRARRAATPWRRAPLCALAVAACAHAPAGERARADLASGAMVALPGGRFLLQHGSGPFEQIPTYVSVRPFLLDATEVTAAAYAACGRAGRCRPAWPSASWENIGEAERAATARACDGGAAEDPAQPARCVDWRQATSYCAWLGKRLPSEEEWEWAARNGRRGTAYPWGDAPPAGQPCWSGPGNDAGGARGGPCPVASHPGDASAAGVKDLAGDVSEWTTSETKVGTDSRGRGGVVVKVIRGGHWGDRDPARVSTASRSADLPDRRDPWLGFRCASDP